MKSLHQSQSFLTILFGWVACFIACSALAYPPAPHHLLTGMVRDELGNPLTIESAEIIFEAASGVRIRSQISPGFKPGLNYELEVPLDSGITQDLYKPTALHPAAPFKIWVLVDGMVYLPIEMRGDFSQLGQPSETTRLDLTLGEDADGDGLPDAWERALLAKSGGDLGGIQPGDDFDGDGLSNLDEYISGNYAFDKEDGFELKIVGPGNAGPLLEFMAIKGRTYMVMGSLDMEEWTSVSFRLENEAADESGFDAYYAEDVREMRVEVVPSREAVAQRFFKLLVQ